MLVLLLCLGASGAQAQSAVLRRPSLHWVRGEDALECVDPRTLSERVEELVGPVLVRAPEAEHSVEAVVSRVKHGALRVQVRVLNVWGGKVGERAFEQRVGSCAELTPAIAFVIAMMIDPDVAAHGLPPALLALLGEEPAEEKLKREIEGEEPVAEPPPPEPAPPPPPLRRRPRPRLDPELPPPPEPEGRAHQLAALVRGSLNETARPSLGLELRYNGRTGSEYLSAGGYARFAQQIGSYKIDDNRSLALTTLDVGLEACGGQRSQARLRLSACLGIEVTTGYGRGEGFSPNGLQVLVTGGAVARLTARLRIVEPFGVMLSINLRAALERREFRYENIDDVNVTVFQTPFVSAGIALGPTWEF